MRRAKGGERDREREEEIGEGRVRQEKKGGDR